MPYSSTGELPPAVRAKFKGKRLRQWMHVWNSEYSRHGDESRAFASAWAATGKGKPGAKREKTTKAGSPEPRQFFLPPWLRRI